MSDDQGQTLVFVQRPAKLLRNLLAVFVAILVSIVWVALWLFLATAVEKTLGETTSQVIAAIGFLGWLPVVFVVGIAVSAKRHVTFYRDESRAQKLLEVLQDKKFYFLTASYTVLDAHGQPLARLRKNYLYDIFRKRWYCDAPSGLPLCTAMEDSILLSLLRRALGSFFGLLRTNFILVRGDHILGEFNRKFTILDRYVLDLSADSNRTFDRRVALAMGVMLDTGERR
ncbi:MAG: hypothetical protein ACRD2M_02715 [Terriglobales bacterium]